MTGLLIALVLQSSLLLPPRTALENPAAVSQIPPKLAKDYASLWARFVAGKEDAKLEKDLDKLLKKQKTFDPALLLQGYIRLYAHDEAAASQKFMQAVAINPKNRIAVYYLAEIANAHDDYVAAATYYAQLMALDPSHPEIETKRQKAVLLSVDGMLHSGARAEGENRLADAEKAYRQALTILPNEASLHLRLADLLTRENKPAEAESEKKMAEALIPHVAAAAAPAADSPGANNADTLDDLGRWGGEINRFHEIQSAESITREQLAALLIHYFPQLMELRQTSQIVTDTQNSWAASEIQTVVGLGLIDPLPNHTFAPSMPVTRGDLAVTLARLIRLLGVSQPAAQPIAAPDLDPANALYPEAQLVVASGVMTLQDSGSFNVSGVVPGREAVKSTERLFHIFQQAPH
ncbi:MAG TPA: S-layer homology domain-containing protein [Terriglobia bacterium]|jgi:tetratricopeptide (TPR) repeat protein